MLFSFELLNNFKIDIWLKMHLIWLNDNIYCNFYTVYMEYKPVDCFQFWGVVNK